MQETSAIPQDKIQPFHNKVHEEADGIVRYFIYGFFFLGIGLSVFYDTYILAFVMGAISLGIYLGARSLIGGTIWFRLIVSLLLWNFAVQFILQMHGMYEMHFFYFIGLTVLLFYEDWRVLVPLIAYAVFTFLYLFYSQMSGGELNGMLENIPELTYKNVILHLGLLLFYGALCILWANLQKGQTRESGINNMQMQDQLSLMDTNINFANSISKGNLAAEYAAEKADKLGESLMNMRDSLVEAAERESKEKFVNVGLASIGEILRNNTDNLEELCDQVIQNLVKYMRANQGGIFILQKDENNDESYLQLMACRAYERKKYLEKRIELGQGLIGQAAIERKTIVMTDVPDHYISITSGLGIANPNSLVLVPLKSNEEIVGVIELASFDVFTDNDIEFLEKVGESIASTIISAQTNQQTKELLEQSRQMTEEMQSQEEEMRQNMEEMQATQEEMGRTQRELGEKEANLNALINNTTDSIITMDRNYKILIMNRVVKERYKGTQYEDMREGANALDMLGDVRDEWKGYYDRALAGEALDFVLKSSVQGEDTYREYFINPIKDDNGYILGVSVFSRDVTDKKQFEIAVQQKSSVLDAMVNNTDNTYFAMDVDYNIIYANKTLKDRFKANGLELSEGMSILDVLSGDALKTWKERYAKTLNGEELRFKEDRPVGDKVLKIITECFPVRDQKGAIIGAAVISKDVTSEERAKEKVEELTAEIEKLKGK
ncbi:GAF domain-containing protein [Fulvivirga lutea]|uniref:GAF domain-containing protein n=1 Tax=Fulvivirga lutea TaxID=2810512 RepID=A0A974WLM5_9BACT|nr:GAF domain-containing protein [Fulvivirga lutea]QSE98495.1 GAF domain-containing protein [Fulvivirga lutea]